MVVKKLSETNRKKQLAELEAELHIYGIENTPESRDRALRLVALQRKSKN